MYNKCVKISTVFQKMSENRRPQGGAFLTHTACDHNSPTSQTDRQTDDMRSQYRALH